MPAPYTRLPTSHKKEDDNHDPASDDETLVDNEEEEVEEPTSPPPPLDPRFNPPPPPRWQRAALLAFLAFLFWLAISMRSTQRVAKIEYAQRYSKEYKYRPAASPIITEKLKDGRTRIRGAHPTGAH